MVQSIVLSALLVRAAVLATGGEDEHGAEHGHHPNVLGLFLGATGEDWQGADFTLGLEYERRLSQSFGIGGIAEYIYGDHKEYVVGVVIAKGF